MTLKDIAKAAGVSVSTVSRIINGNSLNAASKEVQDKIWEIARSGGYIPNTSAQALKIGNSEKKSNHSIACIHARSTDAKNDAFFSALTRSIEQEALKEGYIVKYSFSAFDIHNPATHHQILNNEVDGVAVLGRCDKETLKFLKTHFKKVVYTGLNTLDSEYDQVICDGYAVAADAMEFLFKLGHERIGYIGEFQKEVRYSAYQDALKKHHLPFDRDLTTNVPISSEGGYQGAKRILDRTKNVTAFFCINDITAIGAIKAIQECGFRVPEDISVISMDDIEISQYVSPMLTTMHIPIDEMGKMTAKILIDRINGGHTLPLKLSLPFYLAKRESCIARLPHSR
ncbi:MAG TPA: LacI family transcriptional regulator [Clostridiales bacterium]|nr:LacI family transcriptional regulator [Clostridiales bacterium]